MMRSLFKPGYQWWDEGWRDPNFWEALPDEIGNQTEVVLSPIANQTAKVLWPVTLGAIAIAAVIYRKELRKLIK